MSILFSDERDDPRGIEEFSFPWEEAKHPRDRVGKFAEVVGRLALLHRQLGGKLDTQHRLDRGAITSDDLRHLSALAEQARSAHRPGTRHHAYVHEVANEVDHHIARLQTEKLVRSKSTRELEREAARLEVIPSRARKRSGRDTRAEEQDRRWSAGIGESVLFSEGVYDEVKHPRGRGGKWVEVLGRRVHVVKGAPDDRSTPHRAFVASHLPDIAGSGSQIDAHKDAPLNARLDYQQARSEALAAADTQGFEKKASEALKHLDTVRRYVRNGPTGNMLGLSADDQRRADEEHANSPREKARLASIEKQKRDSTYEDRAGNRRDKATGRAVEIAQDRHRRIHNEGVAADEEAVRQAFEDWSSGRAYLGNDGNYRLKAGGKVAPWNAAVKRVYPTRSKGSSKNDLGTERFAEAARRRKVAEGEADEIRDLVSKLKTPCDCGADNLPHEHGSACPPSPVKVQESVIGGVWDEVKHPRGRGGRFAEVLASLRVNGAHDLGHGVRIERGKILGYKVHTPEGSVHVGDAERAVQHALSVHLDGARREQGKFFMARYSPGERAGVRLHELSSGDEFHWQGVRYRHEGANANGADRVNAKKLYGGETHVLPADTVVEPVSSGGSTIAARNRDGGLTVLAQTRRIDLAGSVSKAQALVDSGLADDLADARAQLADMGEGGGGRYAPGERGNLGAVKREFTPDREFDLTNHYITRENHPNFGTRRVKVRFQNGGSLYVEGPDGKAQQIKWPKASQAERLPDGTIRFYGGGAAQGPDDLFLTFKPVQSASSERAQFKRGDKVLMPSGRPATVISTAPMDDGSGHVAVVRADDGERETFDFPHDKLRSGGMRSPARAMPTAGADRFNLNSSRERGLAQIESERRTRRPLIRSEDRAAYAERESGSNLSRRIDVMHRIVDRHQAEEVDGVLVDVQTANLLKQIHAGLRPENRDRFEKMPMARLADVAWQSVR